MALRRYKPKHEIRTVASSDTPEFLFPDARRMFGFQVIAEKGVGEDNAGDVTIQIGGEDSKILEPGEEWSWPMPEFEAGYFIGTDFKIKVANDGDGVRIFYNQLV